MTQNQRLFSGAVFFAIVWTAFMVWWSANYAWTNIAIMAGAGTFVAGIWFLAMKRFAFPLRSPSAK